MTAPARQPQQEKKYCEHWVVCKHAHALLYCPVDATGKHHKECEYDTRATHTTPPAPEPLYTAAQVKNRVDHAAKAAREQAETTDNIIAVLKKRYRKEMAILDYIEMIECEVVSLKVESLRAQQHDPEPARPIGTQEYEDA